MACVGMIFIKKFQILEKKISFYFISLNFLCYYYCSINVKRQSEHSGLRPDTSSLVSIALIRLQPQADFQLLIKKIVRE